MIPFLVRVEKPNWRITSRLRSLSFDFLSQPKHNFLSPSLTLPLIHTRTLSPSHSLQLSLTQYLTLSLTITIFPSITISHFYSLFVFYLLQKIIVLLCTSNSQSWILDAVSHEFMICVGTEWSTLLGTLYCQPYTFGPTHELNAMKHTRHVCVGT